MLLRLFDCGSEAARFLFEILITGWFIVWCKIAEGGSRQKNSKGKTSFSPSWRLECEVWLHGRKPAVFIWIFAQVMSRWSLETPHWICMIHCQCAAMVKAASFHSASKNSKSQNLVALTLFIFKREFPKRIISCTFLIFTFFLRWPQC